MCFLTSPRAQEVDANNDGTLSKAEVLAALKVSARCDAVARSICSHALLSCARPSPTSRGSSNQYTSFLEFASRGRPVRLTAVCCARGGARCGAASRCSYRCVVWVLRVQRRRVAQNPTWRARMTRARCGRVVHSSLRQLRAFWEAVGATLAFRREIPQLSHKTARAQCGSRTARAVAVWSLRDVWVYLVAGSDANPACFHRNAVQLLLRAAPFVGQVRGRGLLRTVDAHCGTRSIIWLSM